MGGDALRVAERRFLGADELRLADRRFSGGDGLRVQDWRVLLERFLPAMLLVRAGLREDFFFATELLRETLVVRVTVTVRLGFFGVSRISTFSSLWASAISSRLL